MPGLHFSLPAPAPLRWLVLRMLALALLAGLLGTAMQALAAAGSGLQAGEVYLALPDAVDDPAYAGMADSGTAMTACRKPAPSKAPAIDLVLNEIADKDVQYLAVAQWLATRHAAPTPFVVSAASQTDRQPLLRPPALPA